MQHSTSSVQRGLLLALLIIPLTACGPAAALPTAVPATMAPATDIPATAAPATVVPAPATAVPATAAPVPATAVPPPPAAGPQRIQFAPGATSGAVEGSVVRGTENRYVLWAQAGQLMMVRITSLETNAVFTIDSPDGQALAGAEPGRDTMDWSGTLSATGDYLVAIGPRRGNATYRLEVTITTPAAADQSIRTTDWETAIAADPGLRVEQRGDDRYVTVIAPNARVGGIPLLDSIVYVDMDGDGIEEAAIPLASGGTAGNIGFLVYRQATPAPVLVAWQSGYKLGLGIEQGRLVASNALYAESDPNCCPSGRAYDTYVLQGGQLHLVAHRDEGFAEAQPETVRRFYDLLRRKELQVAYSLLSDAEQAANPYDSWAAGYADMLDIEATIAADPSVPNTVRVELTATDRTADGGQVVRRFAGTWELEWAPSRPGWVLSNPHIQAVP